MTPNWLQASHLHGVLRGESVFMFLYRSMSSKRPRDGNSKKYRSCTIERARTSDALRLVPAIESACLRFDEDTFQGCGVRTLFLSRPEKCH